MKTKKKWVLGILPGLALVLGIMLGMSLTAYASQADEYPLWVGDTQVTSANASNIDGSNKASYDATNKTLTLNGYSYSGQGHNELINGAAIYSPIFAKQDLTIEVSGTNDVKNTSRTYGSAACYAVFVTGNLIISGNGTLNAKEGIRCENAITINGGTVNAEVTGESGSGIDAARGVTVNSGTVAATGITAGINAKYGEVKINGGTVTATGKNGIQTGNGDITISGGTVQATGNDGYGIKAESSGSSGSVTIKGENVAVTASGNEGGIYASKGVKNAIAGTGWTDVDGTVGKAAIETSTEGQTLDYKKVQFPAAEKPAATITKAPTAMDLTYNGSAQELVTAGTAEGGTMQYALGTATEATEQYTTSIPTATNAGTYYVWYKAKGDDNHSDTDPACISVTIAPKPQDPTPQDPTPKDGTAQTDASLRLNSDFMVSWKGSTVQVSWGSVPGADTFEVWAIYCGKSKFELIQTVQGVNQAVITSLNGKKLNKKKSVKVYVVAKSGGTVIGSTIPGHVAGPKNYFTNAKRLTVTKNAYSLKVGKTAKLNVKTKKANNNKKLLHKGRLRFASSNPAVATVSSGGRITAVSAGTCDVWIYAQNGRSRKVTVTVQ